MQFDLQDKHYKEHFKNADFLIIKSAKKDVGRLYVEEKEDQIKIIEITISPSFRSKGIGGFVMNEIIERAEGKKYKCKIYIVKTDSPAIRLYERLGFLKEDDTGVYDLMSRQPSK